MTKTSTAFDLGRGGRVAAAPAADSRAPSPERVDAKR
jgi:hypothetical protein